MDIDNSFKQPGEPPEYFTDEHRKVWDEILVAAPKETLWRSDRICLELICHLMIDHRNAPQVHSARILYKWLRMCFIDKKTARRLMLGIKEVRMLDSGE